VWPIAATALLSAAVGALIAFGIAGRSRPAPPHEFTDTMVSSTSTSGGPSDGTAGANLQSAAPATPTQPPGQSVEPQAAPQPPPNDTAAPARGASVGRPPDSRPSPAEREPAARPPSVAPGRLLVRSTPAGAHVFVDGKDAGETPAAIHDLRAGTHVVRIVRDGYVAEERRVAISASRPARSLTLELTPQRAAIDRSSTMPPPSTPGTVGRFLGTLLIDSRPSGAAVFVDGKMSGTTPLELSSVDAGSHALRIELPGYQRWTSAVRVVAGERNRVTASLER
jgi:hypothetical protein